MRHRHPACRRDARAGAQPGLPEPFAEAIGLGIESLRELGITVPAPDRLAADLDRRSDLLYRWLDHIDGADDLGRPAITDPTLLATAHLLTAILPAAYLAADPAMVAWLSLETLRIWLEHGAHPALVGPASTAALFLVMLRGDYSAAYRAKRRILALGEAFGHEPDTLRARLLLAVCGWWFEPIENIVHDARRVREGLIAVGDFAYAGSAYYPAVTGLLDGAPSLDSCVAEVEAGLAFVRRTGSEQIGQLLDSYRWLADVLRGENAEAARDAAPDRYTGNPVGLFHTHVNHALAAAIFGDPSGLERHTAAAMPLLPDLPRPLRDRRGPPATGVGPCRSGPSRRGTSATPCCPNLMR